MCELHWVPDGLLCHSAPLCSALSRGRAPGHPEGQDPGSRQCVCPETRLLSCGDKDPPPPPSPGGCRGTPEGCAALLQPRLERAMIRLARFVHTHKHTHAHNQLSNRSSGLPRTSVLTAKERRSSLNGLVIPAWL